MATCLMCEVCPAVSSQVGSSDYSLPAASSTQLGGVKVGDGLSITADGLLNCTFSGGASYTLPVAGVSALGGVMIGNGLSMAGDTLNVTLSSADIIDEAINLFIKAFQLAGS